MRYLNQTPSELSHLDVAPEHAIITDVRAHLSPSEITVVQVALHNETRAFLVRSGCFRRANLDALVDLCIGEPIIGNVFAAGERLDRSAFVALRLSHALAIGDKFAQHVAPAHGPEAMAAVRTLFAALQKRYQCLMLRTLGERMRALGAFAYSRLATDPERSCMAAWKRDGECFALADTPVLPLADCGQETCACRIIAELGPGTP